MKYEFSDVKTYKKIFGAIASGHTKLGEIRDYIGAKGTDISPYLNLILMTFSPDAVSSINRNQFKKILLYS